MRGKLLTFEGIDGCGKSTQIELLCEFLAGHGQTYMLCREPGGTETGEAIRELLLHKKSFDINAESELLLFMSARAQLVRERIRPVLDRGVHVICDRYADSSLAYQGYGRGLGPEIVSALNRFACGDCVPDRTYLLDLSVEEAQRRMGLRNISGSDRIEAAGSSFMERVREAYLDIAVRESVRIVRLEATQTVEMLQEQIRRDVSELLELA